METFLSAPFFAIINWTIRGPPKLYHFTIYFNENLFALRILWVNVQKESNFHESKWLKLILTFLLTKILRRLWCVMLKNSDLIRKTIEVYITSFSLLNTHTSIPTTATATHTHTHTHRRKTPQSYKVHSQKIYDDDDDDDGKMITFLNTTQLHVYVHLQVKSV